MAQAGQRLFALDFPETQDDIQTGTYEVTGDGDFGASGNVASGTYVDCGVAFLAPTSGRVMIHMTAEMNKEDTNTSTLRISPEVRTGGVVGSGTLVEAAAINQCIAFMANESTSTGSSSANMTRSGYRVVSGLTPGSTYNTRLLHRGSSGGNGIVRVRRITVVPAP